MHGASFLLGLPLRFSASMLLSLYCRRTTVISSRAVSVWQTSQPPFPAEYLGIDETDVRKHRTGIDYSLGSAYPCEKPRGGFSARGLSITCIRPAIASYAMAGSEQRREEHEGIVL